MIKEYYERFDMPYFGRAPKELVAQYKNASRKLLELIVTGADEYAVLEQSKVTDRIVDAIMRINAADRVPAYQ